MRFFTFSGSENGSAKPREYGRAVHKVAPERGVLGVEEVVELGRVEGDEVARITLMQRHEHAVSVSDQQIS